MEIYLLRLLCRAIYAIKNAIFAYSRCKKYECYVNMRDFVWQILIKSGVVFIQIRKKYD